MSQSTESQSRTQGDSKPLSTGAILAYAMPILGTSALLAPTPSVIPGIYNKYFGLEMAVIGSILLGVRLINALASPVIGYLADRYRVNVNSRKIWVLAGGLGLLLCGYFVFIPPAEVSAGYFLFWFTGLFLCNAIMNISHTAWGTELTQLNDDRTKIFTIRSFGLIGGQLLLLGLPLLPIFDTSEYTPEVLQFAMPIIGVYVVVSLYCTWRFVPGGEHVPLQMKENIISSISIVFQSKPFQVLASTYIVSFLATGTASSLTFLVLDSYFNIGDKFSTILVVALFVGIVSLPVIHKLIKRFGRLPILRVALILACITPMAYLLVSPGEQSFIPIMLITIVQSLMVTCMGVVFPILISDVVDYGIWKSGVDQAASYISVMDLLTMGAVALGGFLGFTLAGELGFDPSANTNSSESKLAVEFVYCLLPGVLQIFALMISFKLPLTERRMGVIKKKLNARIQGE